MNHRIIWAVALAVSLPATVFAQPVVTEGERVRILGLDGRRLTGIVTATAPGEVTVRSDETKRELSVSEQGIQLIERAAGTERQFGGTFVLTVGAAALVGGTLSAMSWSPCTSTEFLGCILTFDSRADAFFFGAAAGAVIGIPLGLIAGVASTKEKWEPASMPGSSGTALSIRPIVGRGLGVGVSASVPFGSR